MKIVVLIEGGLVQEVLTEQDAEVLVVDRDCNDEEGVLLVDTEGNPDTEAWMGVSDAVNAPERVEHYWKQIPEEEKGGD